MSLPIPAVVRSKACESAVSRLLGLWVRTPLGARIPVSCGCCVFCQVDVSATVRSLARRSPTECGVSECDLETSTVRRPRPHCGLLSHDGVLIERPYRDEDC